MLQGLFSINIPDEYVFFRLYQKKRGPLFNFEKKKANDNVSEMTYTKHPNHRHTRR